MIQYRTHLTPAEIRERLDRFLPAPWSVVSRLEWRAALVDLTKHARRTPRQDFGGSVGPGWFELTFRPGGRAAVPTIRGTFRQDGDVTLIDLGIGRNWWTTFFLEVLPALFVFLAVVRFAQAATWPPPFWIPFVIIVAIVSWVTTRMQLKHYGRVSLQKLQEELELVEKTKHRTPEQDAPPDG